MTAQVRKLRLRIFIGVAVLGTRLLVEEVADVVELSNLVIGLLDYALYRLKKIFFIFALVQE